MRKNITVDTDFYKIVHWLQRPSNITKLYSYGEPRVGGEHSEICYFGLQIAIMEHLLSPVTTQMIDEGEEETILTGGDKGYFNRAVWERVRDLGYFPIRITSVEEGSIIPEGNVCFTIESTESWFANMLSHFEDILMWPW